jgi:hypothetical protein
MTSNLTIEQIDALLPQIEVLVEQLTRADSERVACQIFVDGLSELLSADRVSLLECPSNLKQTWTLRAVSAAPVIDRNSEAARQIIQKALDLLNVPKVQPQSDPQSSQVFADSTKAIVWRLPTSPISTLPFEALLLEWSDPGQRSLMLGRLKYIGRPIAQAWRFRQDRMAPEKGQFKILSNLKQKRWLIRSLMLCGFVLVSCIPVDFNISADGYLEPKGSNSVYAPCDGYLDFISVSDGSEVKQGQEVGKMQSPELDLRIEDVLGQIRTNSEKKNAMKVALNQIVVGSKTASVEQNRLSSEILIADLHEENLKSKLAFLRQEEAKLKLCSPIQGTVSANSFLEQLQSRPLRRGDPLFDVLDIEGPWHIVLRINDADSLLVKNALSIGTKTVRASFESLPNRIFEFELERCNDIIENPDNLTPFVRAYGSFSQTDSELFFVNAKTKVLIPIGKRPAWYVWLRPIFDTVQKYTLLWK